jgi:hypothetical protein
MICDPRGIADALKDAKTGLQDKIVRNLGDFTVALLAIHDNPERIALAGTGTLLVSGGAHFILTARHVWDKVLSNADHIAITLKPDITHRYSIRRQEFTTFGLPKPDAWNEWGPDLALLRIPAQYVGTIGAYRSYWNGERNLNINAEALEVLVLMGTPAALGTFTGTRADLQISGMFLGPEKVQERNGFDYLDYEMDLKSSGFHTFGGVSGGGVWRVFLFCAPQTGEIDWNMSLHGVAYCELPIVAEHRPVRCHGPQSIHAVIREVG